jgi:hypothetical protein
MYSIHDYFPYLDQKLSTMVFVDGENLAISCGRILGQGKTLRPGVIYVPDIFVWGGILNDWCKPVRGWQIS